MPTLTTNWQVIASRSVYVTNNTTGYNILYARYANLNYHTDRVYWESRFYAYNQYGRYNAWGRTYNDAWSCSLNGQSQSGSKQQGTIYTSTTPVGSASFDSTYSYTSGYFDIDHTNAWSGTLSYTGYCFTSNGTLSGNVGLNALFVTSTPSLTSTAYIGDNVTINTNRSNTNYTHTLSYSFDNVNYTQIATNVGASYTWNVPTSFYSRIPNARQIAFYIRCVTTDGTNTGTTTITATAYVKDSANIPTTSSISYTTDATTQDIAGQGYVIGNYSSVSVSFVATALNSATISQVFLWTGTISSPTKIASANGSGTSFNATLNYVARTYPVYVGTTDSRGYTSYNTSVTIPSSSSYYKNYVVLSVDSDPVIKRDSQTSSDVTINSFKGNFWVGYFNPNTLNDLTIRFRYKEVSGDNWSNYYSIPSSYINIDSQNNTYTISNYTFNDGNDNIDFNYQKAYYVQIEITDLLQTQSYQGTISVGTPSLAIFQDTLKIKGKTLLDYIYPVDSIYLSLNSTNPSVLFGGTWEQIAGGRTLIGAGQLQQNTNTNLGTLDSNELSWNWTAGQTLGEVYHTLSKSEVPHIDGAIRTNQWGGTGDNFVSGDYYGTLTQYVCDHSDIGDSAGRDRYVNVYSSYGGNGRHNTMQPSLIVYIWKRIS